MFPLGIVEHIISNGDVLFYAENRHLAFETIRWCEYTISSVVYVFYKGNRGKRQYGIHDDG